jgi:hypothetical protein
MIKKLAKPFVQMLASVPSSEIAWAMGRGIVGTSTDDEVNSLNSPVYDDEYDVSSPRYDIWKRLLTARSIQDHGKDIRSIFEEVAEIAVAFGYPDDMNELIYYMPATGESSEETLMKRILEYASLDRWVEQP